MIKFQFIKKHSQIVFLLPFVVTLLINGCGRESTLNKEYPQVIPMIVDNSNGLARIDELVSLDINSIKIKYPDFNTTAYVVVDENQILASQVEDLTTSQQISFVCNLPARQTKNFIIRYAPGETRNKEYIKRTQAELSIKMGGKFVNRKYEGGTFQNVNFLKVPPEHTDHSFFIRYEGPGWESDKVGYRFYLDWRNAADIFGKKTHDMVLQNVGQDGFESYHQMSDWGMDILKVGESLGLGSVGMWINNKTERVSVTDSVDCAIEENGPIQSMIRTNYYGWQVAGQKYNLNCWLTIHAGSRMTHCTLQISGDPPNLCTGIVKLDANVIDHSHNGGGKWQYLATYGLQSLASDSLGMAVLFKKDDLVASTADSLSHVLVLKPKDGFLEYYFLAAWEKEPEGIVNQQQFLTYLDQTISMLDTPLVVTLK